MMKLLFLFVFIFLLLGQASAYTEQDINAANFLSQKGVITESSDYKLDSTITRREILKVMMNLSGEIVSDTCAERFVDLPNSDWGCKYAEAAFDKGYISGNALFRPDDSVTEIEALKMISQAKNLLLYENENDKNWWDKYTEGAKSAGILREDESVTISNAKRARVFYFASKSFSDSGVDTIVEGIYEHCYPAGGPTPCVKIDDKNYPLVHTNGSYILLEDWIFTKPGNSISLKILDQKRGCDYGEEGLGCNIWNNQIDLVSEVLELPENVFDSCGGVDTYENQAWFGELKQRNYGKSDDIGEICYSENLGFTLVGINRSYNEFYIRRFWTNTDIERNGIESMRIKIDHSKYEFIEFGERVANIIPITLKNRETQELIIIDYNFVEDEIVEE